MSEKRFKPTEVSARAALREHVLGKARLARERYGPEIDVAAIEAILADRELVRYPTRLEFDSEALQPGEFAWPKPSGSGPAGGFTLFVHERYRESPEVLPLLVAYHLPSISYGARVTSDDAEHFGATLLGLDVEAYYQRLCALADELA